MYLSSRLWAVYRTLRHCYDLSREWIISNRDTAARVQCICAAGFCHLAREVTKKRRQNQEFAIPLISLLNSFSRID